MNQIFRVKIIHGVLTHPEPGVFQDFLYSLKHDWWYELIIRRIVKKRTDNQNRYYWGIVLGYIAMELAGTTVTSEKEEIHRLLARHFLGERDFTVRTIGGIDFIQTPSTTSLDTIEFFEYIEAVRKWAAEFLHINIPDPKKVD